VESREFLYILLNLNISSRFSDLIDQEVSSCKIGTHQALLLFIYSQVVLKAEPSRAICSPFPLPFTSRSEDRSIIVAFCSHALVNTERSIKRVLDEILLLQSGAKDPEDLLDTRRWGLS